MLIAVKAAPQITAEATADVEAMIKKRITERRFDDVVRVVPPPLEKDTRVVELDDSKSKKVCERFAFQLFEYLYLVNQDSPETIRQLTVEAGCN